MSWLNHAKAYIMEHLPEKIDRHLEMRKTSMIDKLIANDGPGEIEPTHKGRKEDIDKRSKRKAVSMASEPPTVIEYTNKKAKKKIGFFMCLVEYGKDTPNNQRKLIEMFSVVKGVPKISPSIHAIALTCLVPAIAKTESVFGLSRKIKSTVYHDIYNMVLRIAPGNRVAMKYTRQFKSKNAKAVKERDKFVERPSKEKFDRSDISDKFRSFLFEVVEQMIGLRTDAQSIDDYCYQLANQWIEEMYGQDMGKTLLEGLTFYIEHQFNKPEAYQEETTAISI